MLPVYYLDPPGVLPSAQNVEWCWLRTKAAAELPQSMMGVSGRWRLGTRLLRRRRFDRTS